MMKEKKKKRKKREKKYVAELCIIVINVLSTNIIVATLRVLWIMIKYKHIWQ